MPNPQDQQAIDGLFDRIEDVARNSQPRDRDAEAMIQARLRDFPSAPYYMAQTILVQEQALQQAQARIEALEAQGQQRGGFLGGLFNENTPRQPQSRRRGPWDRGSQDSFDRGQGGGFLAGAAQTAIGVTGGVLLGSAIAGMFTGGAHAEEYNADDTQDDTDQGGDGDFDGGGDFDVGGDF